MTIAVGDRFRVTATFQFADLSKFQNVYWIRVGGSGTATDADLVTAVKSALISLYENVDIAMQANITADTVLIDRVDWVLDHWEVLETLYDGAWAAGLSFGDAGTLLPRMAAVLVRMIPAIRRHQGRKYLGGFTESSNGGSGAIEVATINLAVAYSLDLMSSYSIGGSSCTFDFVIPNMSGNATNNIISCVVPSTWKRQGRRQHGVGI